ncbi:uncharacterized protein LOC136068235 isoform X1 [Quercus suber]|uniref:uncharacterized protein LOC136068235 isoform X1 n=1 Tax=Quercus suber TaxID=58331 RepID=UPI0032DFBF87
MTTADHMKQGSGFSLICHLKTDLGCMNPLLYHGIREEDVLTSLHQRAFLWESFISHRLLSPEWSDCTWVEFSFVSDGLDVLALKCAADLVYQHNLEDFTLTTAPCITSYNDSFPSIERLSSHHRDKFSGSDSLYEDQTNGNSGQYSYGGQHPCYQLYQTAALDLFPSTPYNCCFPPSKIQDWFSHQIHGCSATMDLPSNLYHNSNWMGLVLYASFSIQGDINFILSNLNSGKSHSLYCQCQMSMANVDDQTIAFSTSKEEITWLLELGEFIWISYVPGEPFKNMLQHCSHIEASFVSDWSGVTVQNCALQLLYQRDQVQFEQELKHCNNLIRENRELVRKQQEDRKKRKQYHVDEGLQRKIFSNIGSEVKLFPRLIDQPETEETKTELGQSDLLENLEKVDKWRVTSKEVTKISEEHLEKGEILEEGYIEEQDVDRGGYGLVLPEDGYEWRKYGLKFIKKIGKMRSYFKCQRSSCSAKKRAEWSTSEPNNLKVAYKGVHNHALPASESGSSQLGISSNANQYDLLTEVFGDRSTTH